MNYDRTIIIEANSIDKINDQMGSNDFIVSTPGITVPRGATIEMDGAIVEEVSAGNDSIIELSNQDQSKDRPYVSSFQLLKMRFYMNNNGLNSISQPLIQNNYLNIPIDPIYGVHPHEADARWQQIELFPNTSVYSIPMKLPQISIDIISGPKPISFNTGNPAVNASVAAGHNPINNFNSWPVDQSTCRNALTYSNPLFLRWNNDGGAAAPKNGIWENYTPEFRMFDVNSAIIDPADFSNNGPALLGMAGIKSAVRKNAPNSEKYTYMQPGYLGPGGRDESQSGGEDYPFGELEIFTEDVPIDLKDSLLETPDEISILINNQLQKSKLQNPDITPGIIKKNTVYAERAGWSYVFQYSQKSRDLYPSQDKTEIYNLTSPTLQNIPANFQNDQTSTVYGEGFFVRNPDKWIGGNNILKINNRKYGVFALDYTEAVNPNVQRGEPLIPTADFNACYEQPTGAETSAITTFLMTTMGFSFSACAMWLDNILFTTDDVEFRVVGDYLFNALNPDPSQGYAFSNLNLDGATTIVSNGDGFTFCFYGGGGVYNGTDYGADKYFLGTWAENITQVGQIGIRFIDLGQPDGAGRIKPTGTAGIDFFIPLGLDALKQIPSKFIPPKGDGATIEFYEILSGDLVGPMLFEAVDTVAVGNPRVSFKVREDITIRGLPYYSIHGTDEGGRLANTDNADSNAEVDEFLSLNWSTIIPTNIQADSGIVRRTAFDRIADYCRRNEYYVGEETDYVKQQEDSFNWVVDLDVGYADDFNNAMSNYLSTQSYSIDETDDIPIDQTDYNIYGQESNYSHILPYYSTLYSSKQYGQPGPPLHFFTANGQGMNYIRPITIYPISRYAQMGCNYISRDNHVVVHSRYHPSYYDVKSPYCINRSDMVTPVSKNINNSNLGQQPHIQMPTFKILLDDSVNGNFKTLSQTKNVAISGCYWAKTAWAADFDNPNNNFVTLGFINYIPTGQNDMKGVVEYDPYALRGPLDAEPDINYRQCFRLLCSCPIGFDPASTTNPFMNAANINQAHEANQQAYVKNFYSKRKVDDSPFDGRRITEDPVYSDGITYSARIEDYVNRCWIGAVAPTITFDSSRMVLTNFYTPRQFSAMDSVGADPNIGLKIAYFNDPSYIFPMLNNSYNTVPTTNPSGGADNTDKGQNYLPAQIKTVRNTGVCDEISGIGIEDLFVRPEGSTSTSSTDSDMLLCSIDISGKTTNYRGCLFDKFGFNLRQFKPRYGKPYLRYSQSNYNSVKKHERDEGVSFFCLNGFLNQASVQNMNVFGPNFNNQNASDRPPNLDGKPAYLCGYVNFQPAVIQVDTDRLRSESLPQKLENAFYMIKTNLPSSRYITNNSELNIISYFYRQYKSGNFYFSYPTSYRKTLTDEFNLTNIHVSILNKNGRPAEHLGDKVSVFIKITIPTVLPEQTPEEAEEYIQASQAPQRLDYGADSLGPVGQLALESLGGKFVNNNPFFSLDEDYESEMGGAGIAPTVRQPLTEPKGQRPYEDIGAEQKEEGYLEEETPEQRAKRLTALADLIKRTKSKEDLTPQDPAELEVPPPLSIGPLFEGDFPTAEAVPETPTELIGRLEAEADIATAEAGVPILPSIITTVTPIPTPPTNTVDLPFLPSVPATIPGSPATAAVEVSRLAQLNRGQFDEYINRASKAVIMKGASRRTQGGKKRIKPKPESQQVEARKRQANERMEIAKEELIKDLKSKGASEETIQRRVKALAGRQSKREVDYAIKQATVRYKRRQERQQRRGQREESSSSAAAAQPASRAAIAQRNVESEKRPAGGGKQPPSGD